MVAGWPSTVALVRVSPVRSTVSVRAALDDDVVEHAVHGGFPGATAGGGNLHLAFLLTGSGVRLCGALSGDAALSAKLNLPYSV